MAPPVQSRRVVIIGAIIAALVAAICSAWISSLWIGQEDAHITYAYAKRIAQGQGFTFSPGARPSLGTTTPLFTLILAFFARMGGPPHVVSPWIGTVCYGAITILLIVLSRKMMGPWLSISSGLFWALSLNIFFRCGGMETPFLILLLIGLALSELREQASPLSAVLIALLLLCRPDSLLIAFLCFGYWILNPQIRPRVFRATVLTTLVCLPWIVYAWLTFGSVVPASLTAKLVVPHSDVMNLDGFFLWYFPLPKLFPVLVGISLVGGIALWRTHAPLRPFLLWVPLYYASMRLGRAPAFAWYYATPLWLTPILVNQAFLSLFGRILPGLKNQAIFVYVILGLVIWTQANLEVSMPENIATSVQKELALLVRREARPQDVTASFEVGALAYYSDRPVLDLMALTSPEVLPWARKEDFEGAIRHFQPRFLMGIRLNGPALGYREITRRPYWAGDYILWKRIQ